MALFRIIIFLLFTTGVNSQANVMDQRYPGEEEYMKFQKNNINHGKTYIHPNLYNYLEGTLPINSAVLHGRKIADKIIHSATYYIGSMADRIPHPAYEFRKQKHLLLLGGSNTFGQWLNFPETTQGILHKRLKDFNVYNFSGLGYAPHISLATLEFSQFYKYIRGTQGHLVYLLYDFHISRVACIGHTLAWNHGLVPRYELIDGKLTLNGMCKDSFLNKVIIFIRRMIEKYTFLKKIFYWSVSYEQLIKNDDIDLTVRVLAQIKATYLEHFQNSRFTVLLSPLGKRISNKQIAYLKSALEQYDIQFVTESIKDEDKYKFGYDKHLNELGHNLHAEIIKSIIK